MADRDYTIFAQIKTKRGGGIFSNVTEDPAAGGGMSLFNSVEIGSRHRRSRVPDAHPER